MPDGPPDPSRMLRDRSRGFGIHPCEYPIFFDMGSRHDARYPEREASGILADRVLVHHVCLRVFPIHLRCRRGMAPLLGRRHSLGHSEQPSFVGPASGGPASGGSPASAQPGACGDRQHGSGFALHIGIRARRVGRGETSGDWRIRIAAGAGSMPGRGVEVGPVSGVPASPGSAADAQPATEPPASKMAAMRVLQSMTHSLAATHVPRSSERGCAACGPRREPLVQRAGA